MLLVRHHVALFVCPLALNFHFISDEELLISSRLLSFGGGGLGTSQFFYRLYRVMFLAWIFYGQSVNLQTAGSLDEVLLFFFL